MAVLSEKVAYLMLCVHNRASWFPAHIEIRNFQTHSGWSVLVNTLLIFHGVAILLVANNQIDGVPNGSIRVDELTPTLMIKRIRIYFYCHLMLSVLIPWHCSLSLSFSQFSVCVDDSTYAAAGQSRGGFATTLVDAWLPQSVEIQFHCKTKVQSLSNLQTWRHGL